MQKIILTLNSDTYPLISFKGRLSLSQLPHFSIDALMPSNDDAFWQNLLGLPINVVFDTGPAIAGIVSAFTVVGANQAANKSIVRFTLQSGLYALTQTQQVRLYLHKTPLQIVEQLLPANGVTRWDWQVKQTLPSKPYRLQANQETDFYFMQRILSREGIYFYSSTDQTGHEMIVFNDNSINAPSLPALSYVRPGATHIADSDDFTPHISRFSVQNNHVAKKFAVNDFFAHVSDAPINVTQGDMQADKINTEQFFHQGTASKTEASQHVRLRQQISQHKAAETIASSNATTLQPGHVIYIDTNALDPAWTQSYFITNVMHRASFASTFQHEGLHYHYNVTGKSQRLLPDNIAYQNSFEMIPAQTAYRGSIYELPSLFPYQSAVVESDTELPNLDAQGNISVRPHFDESDNDTLQALPPIKRMQPSLNPSNENATAVGNHMPLYANSEVLLGHENGDPDRLFAFTSLPNQNNTTPVSSHNVTENKLQTPQGHQMIMDDASQTPALHVQTADGLNRLHMDASSAQPHVALATDLGSMHHKANNNISLQSQQDIVQSTNDSRDHLVQQQMSSASNNNDLHMQAGLHSHVTTQGDLNQNSETDFQLLSGKNMTINASEDATYLGHNNDVSIVSKKGHLTIHAKNICQLIGNGNAEMHAHNGNAGYQIDKTGNVNIYGDTVQFNSQQNVQAKGKVNYQASSTAPFFMVPGTAMAMSPAPSIIVQPSAKHQLKLDTLAFSCFLPKQQSLSYINNTHYQLASILDPDPFIIDTQKIFSGIIKNNQIELTKINLDKPWLLEMRDTEHKMAMYIIAVNGQSCNPTRMLYAKQGQYPLKTETCPKSGNEIRNTNVQLTLLPLPMNFNFRMYSKQRLQNHMQKIPHEFQVSKVRHMLQQDWDHINTALTFFEDNLRDGDPYYRTHFSQEEINYIKNTGNNVTLFIHGFNVPYGNFGHAFDPYFDNNYANFGKNEYYRRVADEPTIADYTDLKSSIYRDPENNILQNYSNSKGYSSSNKLVNGTDAHNWWTDFANNLNLATDKFNHQNYENYTHPIGIAWQGDPSPQNFMADTITGRYSGLQVASIIKQLHLAGITVNVISHSMGAMVLLSAMSLLGQDGQTNAINHTFLWEPAVPNYALSDTQHPSDPDGTWFFPKATEATKTISVLYSNNDNVLGPIPPNQLDQATINASKPVTGELIPALFLTKLGMGSVYAMATWAGISIDSLFHGNNIGKIYQHWVKQHPTDKNGHPFAKTLNEQMETCKTASKDFFYGFLDKLDQIYPDVISDLHAAGHTTEAAMMEAGSIEHKIINEFGPFTPAGNTLILMRIFVDQALMTNIMQQILTVMDVMFNKSRYNPASALGYSGPISSNKDKYIQGLISSNKLKGVNQSKWLWSHSGMKTPSKALMNNVYKKYIIGPKGIKKFGPYS